jgi:hypothetical protein
MATNDTDDQRSIFDGLRGGAPGHATLLAFYDDCAPLAADDLRGLWRGGAWATGTRFDGLLGRIGWYGKVFRGADDVQALLFQRPSTLLGWLNRALIWPFRVPEHRGLVRHPMGRARLREMRFRGQVSAAMVYDYLPIIDHFRRVDATRVIGLMDLRGRRDSQLFFWLERVPGGGDVEDPRNGG